MSPNPDGPLKVKQDEKKPVEYEVFAHSIVKMSDAMNALLKSGLNWKAIVVLLKDRTKLSTKAIEKVLRALQELRSTYTTLPPGK